MPPEDLREALEAAYDEDATEVAETTAESAEVIEGAPVEAAEGATEGAPVEVTEITEGAPAEPAEGAPEVAAEPVEGAPVEDAVADHAAPVSWKPEVREEWAKLPQTVREEVLRRERNVETILHETSQQRKFVADFQRTIAPYETLMASQNATPLAAVQNLMQTAAGLSLGTAPQKAKIVADIINEYGISIDTLDSLLAGEAPSAETAQQNNLAQMLDERLKPMTSFMSSFEQKQQQHNDELQTNVDTEVAEFAKKHDFFEDVREDMAVIMEMASKRQQKVSIDDAYRQAVSMRPDLVKVINDRKVRHEAIARQKAIDKKTAAASSLPSQGVGDPNREAVNLRGAISDAWEQNAG